MGIYLANCFPKQKLPGKQPNESSTYLSLLPGLGLMNILRKDALDGGLLKAGERGHGETGERKKEPKEFEGVEKEGERGSSAGLCGWLHAPVLLGGRGWLNKQS